MRLRNKDIAEQLGISTTAVSFALNNKPGVSEDTRRKVLELVNDSANTAVMRFEQQSDAGKRSVLLSIHKKSGIVMNDKPFFSDIVESAQQELMNESYNMILSHYIPGQDINDYISYIRTLPIDGIILVATELGPEDLAAYRALDIPIVLMDGSFDLENIDSVELDNTTSIYREMNYAYSMGHRSIGYLKSSFSISNFVHRLDGFYKGIREFHLEKYPHPVIELPCDMEGAYRRMSAFLDKLPADFKMPTLFLSDLDYIALGAMNALREHGYRIPNDISIIGYDDISAASISKPALTTTRVNHSDIGYYAAKILVSRISAPRECFSTLQVSSNFIVRESVKKIHPDT